MNFLSYLLLVLVMIGLAHVSLKFTGQFMPSVEQMDQLPLRQRVVSLVVCSILLIGLFWVCLK